MSKSRSLLTRMIHGVPFPLLAGMWLSPEPQMMAGPSMVFEEKSGLVAVEAEHFHKQSKATPRAWYLRSVNGGDPVEPDGDAHHLEGASGEAYLECLPDTRRTHSDKLIRGENFSNEAGKMAVLHYRVHFNTAGRYYVWVRAYSSGSEDNGIHVGLDGQWPESGRRMQWCEGKNSWRWESKQRTEKNHCGEPHRIYLDVATAGEHEILFSMREDGFEFDKFLLTTQRGFQRPEDAGPPVIAKAVKPLPASPMALRKEGAPKGMEFPEHWGPRPRIETRDYRPLPGGYGHGSSTLAAWIQKNLDRDKARETLSVGMSAGDFLSGAKNYYLDQGKWLAIHPEKNKEASADAAFAYPGGTYDVTLRVVGESDGQSTYQLAIHDRKIGDFQAPKSTETYEEGARFEKVFPGLKLESGDVITVSSQIASHDGKEWSRGRVAGLMFRPADQATRDALKASLTAGTGTRSGSPDAGFPAKVAPRKPDGKGAVTLTGQLRQWHKVTLTLDGPFAHERDSDPNPFTDIGFQVVFTHESGSPRYVVPGYFAADGQAAESSAESGTKWRAHLSPDLPGKWNYEVVFRRGKEAALGVQGQDWAPYHGKRGQFEVASTDKMGRDFRSQGRLQYVGRHHLRFAGSKAYFLKVGADAPETLLGYADFDNTVAGKPQKVPLKTWSPHLRDWKDGDPTWKDGKGKGLIGALNYLAEAGANVFSFLTYNAGGDGDNVWPFVERNAKLHYDCSKLDQWGMVFDHAIPLGLYLHFKLQENEMDDNRLGTSGKPGVVPESLDDGRLGKERKLYCREMIARFGHALALNWNIGEENTQSTEEIRDMAQYLHDTDPYQHHIVVHTFPNQQDLVYGPLLGKQSALTGISVQNSNVKDCHWQVVKWTQASREAGRPWVVAFDEPGDATYGMPPDDTWPGMDKLRAGDTQGKIPTVDDIRKYVLWGTLLGGGGGVEYYFGYKLPENDLVCEDWRSRAASWKYGRLALEFFHQEKIPFWEMRNANELVGNEKNNNSVYAYAKPGEVYLVYLPVGIQKGEHRLDLSGVQGRFRVTWFNPRTGVSLSQGSVTSVEAGSSVSLGQPPADPTEDWLVVLRR